MTIQSIPLADIADGGAQMRVEMKPNVVRDYAEDMANGAIFPPVLVYHDGTDYWLGDGFHRVEAARKLEHETIEAEVLEGDARQAILHGCGSNASHGLRRTQADKRRAVERLVRDNEWSKWSDREIAKAARVDHKTVAAVRRELLGGAGGNLHGLCRRQMMLAGMSFTQNKTSVDGFLKGLAAGALGSLAGAVTLLYILSRTRFVTFANGYTADVSHWFDWAYSNLGSSIPVFTLLFAAFWRIAPVSRSW